MKRERDAIRLLFCMARLTFSNCWKNRNSFVKRPLFAREQQRQKGCYENMPFKTAILLRKAWPAEWLIAEKNKENPFQDAFLVAGF